jgi:hypothetical protein
MPKTAWGDGHRVAGSCAAAAQAPAIAPAAIDFRQGQEGLADVLVGKLGEKVPVQLIGVRQRILVPDEVVEREAIELGQIADGDLPLGDPVPVDHEARQDLGQPGPDPARVTERPEGLERADVGVLDQVLGVLRPPRQSHGQPV